MILSFAVVSYARGQEFEVNMFRCRARQGLILMFLTAVSFGLIACADDETAEDPLDIAEDTPTASESPTATESPTETATGPTQGSDAAEGETVELELVAEDIAFSENEFSVPAGSDVVMEFTNEDQVPHDFALWESDATENNLFDGEDITGPDETVTYEFTAPEEPGDYFFNCTIHPQTMTGTFTVTEG